MPCKFLVCEWTMMGREEVCAKEEEQQGADEDAGDPEIHFPGKLELVLPRHPEALLDVLQI